jgi:hypothetical protein
MRRIVVMLLAAMMIVALPAAAFAQTDEAVAAAALLKEKADAAEGSADAAAWADALAEVETAFLRGHAFAPARVAPYSLPLDERV